MNGGGGLFFSFLALCGLLAAQSQPKASEIEWRGHRLLTSQVPPIPLAKGDTVSQMDGNEDGTWAFVNRPSPFQNLVYFLPSGGSAWVLKFNDSDPIFLGNKLRARVSATRTDYYGAREVLSKAGLSFTLYCVNGDVFATTPGVPACSSWFLPTGKTTPQLMFQ
jgi:hypothetical protein